MSTGANPNIDWWKIATSAIGAILVAVLLGWYNDYKEFTKQANKNQNDIELLKLEVRTNERHTNEKLGAIDDDLDYIITGLDDLRSRP